MQCPASTVGSLEVVITYVFGFTLVVGTKAYTVEGGSLHKLRLESLKLGFQPLHKFLVNKL